MAAASRILAMRGAAESFVTEVVSLTQRHEKWRRHQTLNLIPSENVTSSPLRQLLTSDLGHRYTDPAHYYMGARYLDEAQELAARLARHVFRARFAEVRLLSGHMCHIAVFLLFTRKRDRVVAVDPHHGGYPGVSADGLSGVLGRRTLHFPFDEARWNVDVHGSRLLLRRHRPELVLFGSSCFLFPHPVAALRSSVEAALTVYDGSHVLGLIAGREFQDPLREGVHLLIGSTHKTFFGPQGGLIVSNDDQLGTRIASGLVPAVLDNAHWNRIAALAYALAEMWRFGRRYARQVVQNAQTLGKALADAGLPVVATAHGCTQSHQVAVFRRRFGSELERARVLEAAGIIVDAGMRLGTGEATRRGMGAEEMLQIAEWIADLWFARRKPQVVRREVRRFMRDFADIRYTFPV